MKGNNILDSVGSQEVESEHDAFELLCDALDIKEKEIVAVFTAYFDESYNQRSVKRPDEPLLYTVACCLSTKEQWTKFGVRWKSALASKPKADFFHMTDYENRVGVYSNWCDTARLEKLQRLHRIMNEHILFGAAGVVNCADFDVVNLERYKHPKLDYYLFDVIVCMEAISDWCELNNYNEPIHYIFAHLDKQGALLDRFFTYCLKTPVLRKRYKMTGLWTKGFAKEVAQLQAADIFAYELNKRAVNEFGDDEKFTRKSLENLKLDYVNFTPLYYGKEEIRSLFENIGGAFVSWD